MKKLLDLTKYYTLNYINKLKIRQMGEEEFYSSLCRYGSREKLSVNDTNLYIQSKIIEGKPFCAGRFGATELFAASMYEFDVKSKKEKAMKQLANLSGFFPEDSSYGNRFNDILIDSLRTLDLIGIWNLRFEDYYIKKYADNGLKLTFLLDLEPWRNPENPWTCALKGKKVLVVHPFEESIRKQYDKREYIFPRNDILPDFSLITFKAVQTAAGMIDDRFDDWFQALDWMYKEIIKIDFDIAIIGCGAYGLPLAAKIKEFGKQAIHLGGATQLLFGIKGHRWVENEGFAYVNRLMNDSWIYPSENERPLNASAIENGCYW